MAEDARGVTPGGALDALAEAAGAEEGLLSSEEGQKKRNPQYEPMENEGELSELRLQGLTPRGEKKLRKGDLRCRPPGYYRERMFEKTLPQFRLSSVVAAARAEDIIMVYAYLKQKESKLRTSEFRFDPEVYLKDAKLVADLQLINTCDELEKFLKTRFGTVRQPKREPGEDQVTGATTATAFNTTALGKAAAVGGGGATAMKVEVGAAGPSLEEMLAAEAAAKMEPAAKYKSHFEDDFKKHFPKLEITEANKRSFLVRALHKAAREGQAQAAIDLATELGDFNAEFIHYGIRPLHQTVFGHIRPYSAMSLHTADMLLAKGADIDAPDTFGRTALYYASRRGDLQMMVLLLNRGADPNYTAKDGSTPLHVAAEKGGVQAVLQLLAAGAKEKPIPKAILEAEKAKAAAAQVEEAPVPIEESSDEEEEGELELTSSANPILVDIVPKVPECGTALHWAARAGQAQIVNHLLNIAGFDPNARDWHDSTPLHLAANEYRDYFASRCRSLLTKKEDLEEDAQHTEPISEEKTKAYVATIRYLLGHGANREAKNKDNRTPLHLAAARGNLKCVRLLLSSRTPKEDGSREDFNGQNPFMLAVIGSDEGPAECTDESEICDNFSPPMEDLLKKAGFDINSKDLRGRTALHLAVLTGKSAVAKQLLANGARVNEVDNDGATPLILAARARQVGCVKVLLEYQPDINAVDNMGCSALGAAAWAADAALVNLLLLHGADVNLVEEQKDTSQSLDNRSSHWRTPLHEAAEGGDCDIVDSLLARGADVTRTNNCGRTALHEAAHFGNAGVVQLLLNEGADIAAKDNEGYTALDLAIKQRNGEVVRLLKDAGAVEAVPPSLSQRPIVQSPAGAGGGGCEGAADDEYSTWNRRFALMLEFIEVHKRVPAPGDWYKNFHIGSWVELQKEKLRWNEMPEDELKAIGSKGDLMKDWGVAIPWMDWLNSLKEYVSAHGEPPAAWEREGSEGQQAAKVAALGFWCKYQQCRYLGGSLLPSRVRELEAIRQWEWDTPERREKKRKKIVLQLQLYVRRNKSLPEPKDKYFGIPLGRWCQAIRLIRARGELPKTREEQILNASKNMKNAVWTWMLPAKRSTSFDDKLELLQKEVGKLQRSGQEMVQLEELEPRLGLWVSTQKAKYEAGELEPHEASKLAAILQNIHMPGGAEHRQLNGWDECLSLLREWVSQAQRWPTTNEQHKGLYLGRWLRLQRQKHGQGKLPENRKAALAEVAPRWWEEDAAIALTQHIAPIADANEAARIEKKLEGIEVFNGRGLDVKELQNGLRSLFTPQIEAFKAFAAGKTGLKKSRVEIGRAAVVLLMVKVIQPPITVGDALAVLEKLSLLRHDLTIGIRDLLKSSSPILLLVQTHLQEDALRQLKQSCSGIAPQWTLESVLSRCSWDALGSIEDESRLICIQSVAAVAASLENRDPGFISLDVACRAVAVLENTPLVVDSEAVVAAKPKPSPISVKKRRRDAAVKDANAVALGSAPIVVRPYDDVVETSQAPEEGSDGSSDRTITKEFTKDSEEEEKGDEEAGSEAVTKRPRRTESAAAVAQQPPPSPPAASELPSFPASAATTSGKPPASDITREMTSIPGDLLPILQRAWKGDGLKSKDVLAVLGGWKAANLPVSQTAPFKPQGGSVFMVSRDSKYKQDGYVWNKETHANLKVKGEERIKCYYATLTASGLQRRCYWDKRNENVVLLHYLPEKSNITGSKRAATPEMTTTVEGASEDQPPSRPLKSPRPAVPATLSGPSAAAPGGSTGSKIKLRLPGRSNGPPLSAGKTAAADGVISSAPLALPPSAPAALPAAPAPSAQTESWAQMQYNQEQEAEIQELKKKLKAMEQAAQTAAQQRRLSPPASQITGMSQMPPPQPQFSEAAGMRFPSWPHPLPKHSGLSQQPTVPAGDQQPQQSQGPGFKNAQNAFNRAPMFTVNAAQRSALPASSHQTGGGGVNDGGAAAGLRQESAMPPQSYNWAAGAGLSMSAPPLQQMQMPPSIPPWASQMPQASFGQPSFPQDHPSWAASTMPSPLAGGPSAPMSMMQQQMSQMSAPAMSGLNSRQPQQSFPQTSYLPPTPASLPPEVLNLVNSASTSDKFAMSRALKALYDSGVGGSAMRWAALQAAGNKLDGNLIKYIFEEIKGYVVEGKLQEAVEWVQDMKELYG